MNNMNFLRLTSLISFWVGVCMTLSFSLLFIFKPNWELIEDMFLTQFNAGIYLTMAVLPFPISVIARYLSKT